MRMPTSMSHGHRDTQRRHQREATSDAGSEAGLHLPSPNHQEVSPRQALPPLRK
jgi:hypothetical protein